MIVLQQKPVGRKKLKFSPALDLVEVQDGGDSVAICARIRRRRQETRDAEADSLILEGGIPYWISVDRLPRFDVQRHGGGAVFLYVLTVQSLLLSRRSLI